MLLLPVLLSTVISLAVGYGDGNYGTYGGGYYGYEDHKSHVEKHGKDYIMITCPVDSQKYALIAEDEGSTAEISGTKYSDTVVLADGIQIGVMAKCSGNRITAETTNGDKIRIKKVACIQYPGSITSDSSTCSACSLCNIEPLIVQMMVQNLPVKAEEIQGPGQCKQVKITCGKDPTGKCLAVKIGLLGREYSDIVETALTMEDSISVVLTCQNDMTFTYDALNKNPVNSIGCLYERCTN